MASIDHTQNIIELNDVSFSYDGKNDIVKDISFSIHKGDYLGVIGPNGGGKTTLLKIMLGLLKPTRGTVRLFGTDIRKFKDWSRIGYVAQKATNFDTKFPVTVEEVVIMGSYARRGLFHASTAEDLQRVHEALSQVEMLEYTDNRIGDLSGGQQQRVFIARALVSRPDVLFLDEPTVGVDAVTQEQFYLLLKRLNTEFDLTLVLVSHELDVVAHQATEIACINGGLVSYCTPDELMKEGGIEKLYGKDLKYILHTHHN